MNTDLQPNAEQPRLTRKVNAFAGVCISVHLCLSVVSAFQLPNLGSWQQLSVWRVRELGVPPQGVPGSETR